MLRNLGMQSPKIRDGGGIHFVVKHRDIVLFGGGGRIRIVEEVFGGGGGNGSNGRGILFDAKDRANFFFLIVTGEVKRGLSVMVGDIFQKRFS